MAKVTGRAVQPEAIVDGALHLAVADEDRDGVAELLADLLLASLESGDRADLDVLIATGKDDRR
jgi:hypothetical protein